MASTVTLLELRDRVKDRSDADNGGPVSDSQIDSRINEALRHVYAELLKVRGDEYYETDVTFTTTPNVSTVDLPADFLKAGPSGVWWVTGTDLNLPIHRYSPGESELQIRGVGWTYHPAGANIKYHIRGSKIRFLPMPLGAHVVKFNYIPTPPTLVNDEDTYEGYQGFEEAIVWLATAYCLAKEESDTSFAMQRYAECMQMIREQAPRDECEPPCVQWMNPSIAGDGDHGDTFW